MKQVAYRLTAPSGKQYIGITKRGLSLRWKEHVRLANRGRMTPLHAAIRKYGADSFIREVLVESDWRHLCELEKKMIALWDTQCPHGYNTTSGGEMCDANKGRKLSPEWRKKLSDAQRARWAKIQPEDRTKIARKSWKNSKSDRKQRHSERMQELHSDPEWRSSWETKYRNRRLK